MTKVKLEFKLPEDEDEFNLASKGKLFFFACQEFDNYLRDQLKYHGDKYSNKEYKLIENIRDKFNEIIREETNINDWYCFVK